ncbi:hypothetical protein GCM10018954_068050 [Kutzneria kofuensis]
MDVHPFDVRRAADRVGDRVQAVTHQAVHPAYAGLPEHLDELVGDGLRHSALLRIGVGRVTSRRPVSRSGDRLHLFVPHTFAPRTEGAGDA